MAQSVNLNTATSEELSSLPGIGPAIADRIIAARPYDSVDNLKRVEGIGPKTLERLEPIVTFGRDETLPEGEGVTEAESRPEEEAEPPLDARDSLEEESPAPTVETSPERAIVPIQTEEDSNDEKTVSQGRVILISLASSFVAFVLAVALTLGVIVGINGGLRFARPAQVAQMDRHIQGLQTRTEILTQDLDGVRSRLANLETVGDRVNQLENDVDQIDTDLAELRATTEELRSQAQRVQSFFAELRQLLDTLLETGS